MITGDDIYDALNLLPEELLVSVDARRKKKTFHFKSFAAAAACLCLFAVIWFLTPPGRGTAKENAMGGIADGIVEENSTTSVNTVDLIVITVTADSIIAEPIQHPSADGAETEPVTIMLDNVEENTPSITPGQKIRVYYTDDTVGSLYIRPCKIENIKEESP